MSQNPFADIIDFIQRNPDTLDAWVLGRILASLNNWSLFPYSVAELGRISQEAGAIGFAAVKMRLEYGEGIALSQAAARLTELQPWLADEAVARINWFSQRERIGRLSAKEFRGRILMPDDSIGEQDAMKPGTE